MLQYPKMTRINRHKKAEWSKVIQPDLLKSIHDFEFRWQFPFRWQFRDIYFEYIGHFEQKNEIKYKPENSSHQKLYIMSSFDVPKHLEQSALKKLVQFLYKLR